ncbi:hypothetical protein NDU88_002371 [Pleurodeles waltl]|uniref:Uncharacterized protein n=1 Tax=Pleurodeles waltl TaxID=8319 RepID=A0AAV7SDK3_PLEWA|nr:hypothetical protein NDU88_002371 [Pleurodeles waltl]
MVPAMPGQRLRWGELCWACASKEHRAHSEAPGSGAGGGWLAGFLPPNNTKSLQLPLSAAQPATWHDMALQLLPLFSQSPHLSSAFQLHHASRLCVSRLGGKTDRL